MTLQIGQFSRASVSISRSCCSADDFLELLELKPESGRLMT